MTAGISYPSTSELLLEWDRRRPRSQQRELGWSEIGGCERRAGYRLAGTEPSNVGGSVQAVLGTAIHDAVASVLRETAGPNDLAEHAVIFAGIPGTLDRYEADTLTVVDVKTTSSRWLEHIRIHGPSRDHIWQVHGYGGALVADGIRVRHVRIDYIARDTGEEYTWAAPFDPAYLRDALGWLDRVRQSPVDLLPREYEPDGPFCQHCPFLDICWEGGVVGRDPRSVLYVEDPDAARWAQQLWDAKETIKAAKKLEAEAKGALDAIRPNIEGSETVDVGFDVPLKFQVSKGQNRIDTAAVRAEYAAAGAKPPMKRTGPSVTLKFAGDEDGDS